MSCFACPEAPALRSQAFVSDATDVRKAVVSVLVALHISLRSAFTIYAEAYLSMPQQKLLQMYIDKASGVASLAS